MTTATTDSNAELKATKELFTLAVGTEDDLDKLLAKTTYWRTLQFVHGSSGLPKMLEAQRKTEGQDR